MRFPRQNPQLVVLREVALIHPVQDAAQIGLHPDEDGGQRFALFVVEVAAVHAQIVVVAASAINRAARNGDA